MSHLPGLTPITVPKRPQSRFNQSHHQSSQMSYTKYEQSLNQSHNQFHHSELDSPSSSSSSSITLSPVSSTSIYHSINPHQPYQPSAFYQHNVHSYQSFLQGREQSINQSSSPVSFSPINHSNNQFPPFPINVRKRHREDQLEQSVSHNHCPVHPDLNDTKRLRRALPPISPSYPPNVHSNHQSVNQSPHSSPNQSPMPHQLMVHTNIQHQLTPLSGQAYNQSVHTFMNTSGHLFTHSLSQTIHQPISQSMIRSPRHRLTLTPISIPSPPLSPYNQSISQSLSHFSGLGGRYRMVQTIHQSLLGAVKLAEAVNSANNQSLNNFHNFSISHTSPNHSEHQSNQRRYAIKIGRTMDQSIKREATILRYIQSNKQAINQPIEQLNVPAVDRFMKQITCEPNHQSQPQPSFSPILPFVEECVDDEESSNQSNHLSSNQPKYRYLIGEYAEQGDLLSFLDRSFDRYNQSNHQSARQTSKQSLTQWELIIRSIILSLVLSLYSIHQLGVVHLDLSLENVCLIDCFPASANLPLASPTINHSSDQPNKFTTKRAVLIDFGHASVHPSIDLSPYQLQKHTNNHSNGSNNPSASPTSTLPIDRFPIAVGDIIPMKSSFVAPEIWEAQTLNQSMKQTSNQPISQPNGQSNGQSPGQPAKKATYDGYAADMFALGVLIFTLATGHAPFSTTKQPSGQSTNQSTDHNDGQSNNHSNAQSPTPSTTQSNGQSSSQASSQWYQSIISSNWLTEEYKCQKGAAIYAHLSDRLLDLIDRLIKPVNKRATILEVLQHPWFDATLD